MLTESWNKLSSVIVVFFLVIACQSGLTQDLYHSPYSVYGLGILNEHSASLNRGLAGTGIGIQDERNLNHVNPASYAAILFPVTHIYEAGGYLESNRYRTSKFSESKLYGGLTNLSYWFRFKPWFTSAVGISPYSSVSYNITTRKNLAIAPEATYIYEGDGNITQLFWGNGFRITKNLYAGTTLSYLFGTITRSETVSSGEASNTLTLENKTFTNKMSVDFGLQYKINLLKKALVFGAVYNNGLVLKGKSNLTLQDANFDTLTHYKGKGVEYKLPKYIGAGISLSSKRSTVATDVKFTSWSQAAYLHQDIAFRDTWKFSAGYAYYGNDYAEGYVGTIGFRMGFHFQQHYLILKGANMNAWGATVGLSLPVSEGRSLVNITYSFDQLGTLRNNLILHQAQKIGIDFVVRDIWGIKRKFD